MRAFVEPKEGGATLSRRACWTNSTDDISDFSALDLGISDAPAVMVISMINRHRQKGWREFETIGEAAARLLAGLDARTEKLRLAGGLLGPAKITDQPAESHARADIGPSESDRGPGTLDRSGQHFTAEGVGGSDPATQKTATGSGFEKVCGRAGLLDILRDDGKDTARPGTPDESLRQIANTYCDAPEDL